MLDMVIASFLKIWHIIPIIIGVILFKKYIDSKDRKRRVKLNEEFEKEGLSLALRTGQKYEKLGYEVVYNQLEDENNAVELICSKDGKTLLFQCKKETNPKSISADDIEAFIDEASKYVKSNSIDKSLVELRCAVLHPEIFDKSAMKLLSDDNNNCKYIVL